MRPERIAAVLLLALGVVAAAQEQPPLTHGLTAVEPYPAPELVLEDMDDDAVDLASLRGNVVVINFWATWCPPCRREMPSLERMHQAIGAQGVSVLAVNVGEDFETVFGFLGAVDPSPTFPVLFDRDGDALQRWGVRGLPTTYIVDPAGRVVARAIGGREFDHPELMQRLSALAGN